MKPLTRIEKSREYFVNSTLDELLEEISVLPCVDMIDDFKGGTKNDNDMFQLNTLLEMWYAVSTECGIIAYFSTQEEAYYYRLDYINRVLNN